MKWHVALRFILLAAAVLVAAAIIPPLVVRSAFGQTYVGPLQRTELPAASQLVMSTGKSLVGVTPGAGLTLSGGSLTANVVSVQGRTGAVVLAPSDFTSALGYQPVNQAGDTMTGTLGLHTAMSVAAAGTNAATATVLSAQVNFVTSVGLGQGVRLQTGLVPARPVTVANRGANVLAVYPASGAAIEGYGANNPVGIAVGGQATIRCDSTQCYAGGW